MREGLLQKRGIVTGLVNKIDIDKKERAALQQRMETIQQTVSQHEVEIARLRSKIIQSPQRVKASLSDLSKNVAKMKEDVLDQEAKGRDHQARIAALKKYEIDIAALIKTVEEWEVELNKAAEEQTRLAALSEERIGRTEDLKELELYEQQLLRRINNAHEQRERHGKQSETKKESVQRKLSEMQDTHESLLSQRKEVNEETAKWQRAIALKEREVCTLLRVT